MKLCIMCDNSKVDVVRERAKKIFNDKSVLKVPLSESGEGEPTHWFCDMDVSERAYLKLKSMQVDSIMEISNKKDFLNKYGLKVIES